MKSRSRIIFFGFFVLCFLFAFDICAAHVIRVHDFTTTKIKETAVPFAEILKSKNELVELYAELQNIPTAEAEEMVNKLRINFMTQKVIVMIGEKGTVINRDTIDTYYSDNKLRITVEMIALDKLDDEERETQLRRTLRGYPVIILVTDPDSGVTLGRLARITCCIKGLPCDDTNNIGSWIRQ